MKSILLFVIVSYITSVGFCQNSDSLRFQKAKDLESQVEYQNILRDSLVSVTLEITKLLDHLPEVKERFQKNLAWVEDNKFRILQDSAFVKLTFLLVIKGMIDEINNFYEKLSELESVQNITTIHWLRALIDIYVFSEEEYIKIKEDADVELESVGWKEVGSKSDSLRSYFSNTNRVLEKYITDTQ
ncbi:MAG: hypothetical protein OEX08_03385 [Candidatus Nomurabacteria bacterium]|nr:hypothetical protein [Candidatus Nomurabacteria bacterium]